MGITIHYTFVRRMPPQALLHQVAAKARRMGMRVERFSTTHLLINPHPDSESIDLHFRQWKSLQNIDDTSEDADECSWLRQEWPNNSRYQSRLRSVIPVSRLGKKGGNKASAI